MVLIRQAVDPRELKSIYRLRYSIYVDEMNRAQPYADHAKQLIVDPLDQQDGCGVLGAWDDNEIVGTVRTNFLCSSAIGDYYELYRIADLPSEVVPRTSITTRLMIVGRLRKSTLATRLACEMFRFGLQRGITTDLIDCNEHLVTFFLSLGYRVHRDAVVHPDYGRVTVMRLNLTDFHYFEQIRSPFRKIPMTACLC
jgi:N-acyl-L-homoserine lactone synthetase